MLANDFFNRNSTGHCRLWSHCRGYHAKGKSGGTPYRIEQRWADLALIQQFFKFFEMFDFLFHHMLDFSTGTMVAQDRKLAFINLLGGALTGVINPQKTLYIAAVCHR